ncbi:unnamed protein product [Rotaria sordida]|uniref:Uncharacterized protein n=1 Tax=Rotaria sordida TaxID=392033 RepID=A0A815Q3M6_9BILA|nr:unnamed protein product [Rotaria sordida]CAF1458120.1 unnamed protein product [Rotaria sordida]CAF3834603.1 unnamed protein product [Rotaria sordida]CAF4104487.1 unnamed protein product [Rotaria sordida]
MAHLDQIHDVSYVIIEEDDFKIDEAELIDLRNSVDSYSTYSTPSNFQSDSVVADETCVRISSVQSTIPSSTSPLVFYLPKSFRWLLPPSYDLSTIVWLETDNTPEISLLSDSSSPKTESQSDIQAIANELFCDIKEEMTHDTEFVNFFREWCPVNQQQDNNNSTRVF